MENIEQQLKEPHFLSGEADHRPGMPRDASKRNGIQGAGGNRPGIPGDACNRNGIQGADGRMHGMPGPEINHGAAGVAQSLTSRLRDTEEYAACLERNVSLLQEKMVELDSDLQICYLRTLTIKASIRDF